MHTTYDPTWILVADASRARLFKYAGFGAALEELAAWQHPKSRARNSELMADRPGRVAQSHAGPHPGHGSRSGMEPDLSARDQEHVHFARELAAELAKGLHSKAYGQLVLVANPEFLGTLRHVSDEQVLKHTIASVDKDYTALPTRDLEDKLKPLFHA